MGKSSYILSLVQWRKERIDESRKMDYYLSSTQFMAPKVVILFSYQFVFPNTFEVFGIAFADCKNKDYIMKDINYFIYD